MKVQYFIYLLFIIFIYLNIINISLCEEIQCGENTIKNCLKCDSSENSDTCSACEEKYFPFFNDILCLPCSDPLYGQVNCEGNCDNSNYVIDRNVKCEKGGCKEGYYNLKGNCTKCDENHPGCAKCSYELEEGQTQEKFECLECLKGYRKDLNGECQECYKANVYYGDCFSCSDDISDYDICRCHKPFTNKGDSECVLCPDGCQECVYNSELGDFECLKCYLEYILNSDKKCSYCGQRCGYCIFEDNNEPNCLYCYSQLYKDNNKCGICSNGCLACKKGENSDDESETVCTECYGSYVLDEKNNKCIECQTIDEISEDNGCYSCIFNENEEKYECLNCRNNDSVYISNTYQCLNNKDPNKPYFGCLKAIYDEITKKYECLKCKDGYIPVKDDSKCINPYEYANCAELEYLEGTKTYSCFKCQNYLALIQEYNKDKKNCYVREKDLSYCLSGKKDESGNLICLDCVENAQMESGICKCNADSLGKNNQFCDKCDVINSNGQCFLCEYDIGNCDKCHFDEKEGELKCDNCISVYSLSERNDKCEYECKEYSEISPGCMICKDKLDKLDEYKRDKKCQFCKNGYFQKTDYSCVYCRSENYGGPACYECGYEVDENGKETENIICKFCYSYFNYLKEYNNNYAYDNFNYFDSVLSSKGKCYNCSYDLSESCLKCDFVDNKLTCLLCSPGYYIDSNGKGSSFMDKINKIPNCYQHQFSIGDYSFYLYNYIDKDVIRMNYDLNTLYDDYKDYNEALFF